MDAPPQTLDSPIKEYPYRYSWFGIFMILFGCGLIAWVAGREALFTRNILTSLTAAAFAILFLLGLYQLVVNLVANLKLKVTSAGLYLPSIWRWNHPDFIPFASITKVEVSRTRISGLLLLYVGKHSYSVTQTSLPREGHFLELVDILHARLPDVFTS